MNRFCIELYFGSLEDRNLFVNLINKNSRSYGYSTGLAFDATNPDLQKFAGKGRVLFRNSWNMYEVKGNSLILDLNNAASSGSESEVVDLLRGLERRAEEQSGKKIR